MAFKGTYEPWEERGLFDRMAEGEEDAFNTIYQHFMHLLSGAILRLVKSEADAAEVLQEAFMRIWLNRDSIPGIENPGGWVRRIIINECYRLIKKNHLRSRLHDGWQSAGPAEATSGLHAEQRLVLGETARIIQEALGDLSPRQYAIYRLSREQGRRIAEIAQILGLSPDYVKKTLAIALQKIRKKLRDAGKLLPAILLF
ncbi:RNA polymerase sigma factor [Chitinophaga sp. XS-30]|uniref:RNA polymerase sigma factor n=1 Tax=Chitinophaga sp. XS-30 TaxID=2604421 RepID=UPI0011DDC907|nr:sigma-70 family RNA polymerase sigma factor [Chitinophaga sp. XS-30]QEH39399.1 sigma-70 family RNA polymerase sigma factor [Chitinophaga sp. XS-30]